MILSTALTSVSGILTAYSIYITTKKGDKDKANFLRDSRNFLRLIDYVKTCHNVSQMFFEDRFAHLKAKGHLGFSDSWRLSIDIAFLSEVRMVKKLTIEMKDPLQEGEIKLTKDSPIKKQLTYIGTNMKELLIPTEQFLLTIISINDKVKSGTITDGEKNGHLAYLETTSRDIMMLSDKILLNLIAILIFLFSEVTS